uniref:Transmembrane protein 254 n=2 Tax=Marmota marmota marmota TaxID=9994 RepID=A0A8C6EX78_MARMA
MATIAGDAAYFQRGSLLWFTVITLSFGDNSCDVLWSQSVPYQRLGPLGYFTQCLVNHHHTLLHNGYWLAWLIHMGESLYAMVLCKYKGIRQLGSTTLVPADFPLWDSISLHLDCLQA